tara:strand:+ start:22052 stop:23212 length:1161 start_codon:yes stop_codon:yes gene_type:complete
MKKILVVHNKYRNLGGEDTSVVNEVNFLKEHYRVEILYFENNITNYFSQFFYFITGKNLHSKKIFSRKLDSYNPDIVYVHNTWFKTSVSIFDELEKRNIKTVVKMHNFRYYCSRYFLQSKHIIDKKSCQACGLVYRKRRLLNKYFDDSIIKSIFLTIYSKKLIKKLNSSNVKPLVLTNFHKNFIRSKDIIKNKIDVIPNYLDTSLYKSKGTKENEKKYIVYAGRLSKEKGLPELISAFEKSNLNDVTLKICGEGPLEIKKYINKDIKNIEILGVLPNDEIRKIISNSLAVVTATKLFEGQPTLLCEASASGVISIFPKTGGIQEFFPSDNLFSYEQFNYEELTNKIELLKDRELINKQAALNSLLIKEKLDETELVKKFNEVFENE